MLACTLDQAELQKSALAQEFKACDQCAQPITGKTYYQVADKVRRWRLSTTAQRLQT